MATHITRLADVLGGDNTLRSVLRKFVLGTLSSGITYSSSSNLLR